MLTVYGGTKIGPLGTCTLKPVCAHQMRMHSAQFFVVDTAGPDILGLPMTRKLGLITVHVDAATVLTTTTAGTKTERFGAEKHVGMPVQRDKYR